MIRYFALKNPFIKGISPFWALRSTFSGFLKILTRLLRRKNSKRFLLLSPPCMRLQSVFDRKLNRFFTLRIRDRIDLGTVRQIFQAEGYGLFRLNRYNDLKYRYQSILDADELPVIFDFGANIGASAKYFNLEWPEALIVCVEPDRDNFDLAKLNNNSQNVKFYFGAVGSKVGKANLLDPGVGNNGYRTETSEGGSVRIFSVYELLEREAKRDTKSRMLRPFIAKIDIEGAEDELFSENADWSKSFELLIVELHDWMLPGSASSGNFLKTISVLKRDFVYIGENVFSIKNAN